MAKSQKPTLAQTIPWLLILGGSIGLVCSFILSLDKFKLAENPHFIPSCNLNPVIACGNVMSSDQGSVFGFPNPFIGLATFAALVTVGVALVGGAKFKRWFWLGLETGMLLGLAFAYWLLFESIYRIHALCPYCLSVDVVVITLAWYVGLYLIDVKYIPMPTGRLRTVVTFVRAHHLDILVLWFAILIGLTLKHFWYYYGHHL